MNLSEKLSMLNKNQIQAHIRAKADKLERKYLELKKLYDEVESSLKQGHINIIVRGNDEKKLAKKYFTDCWVGCFGDCVTEYVLAMSESGIKKLEEDYLKAKEAYDNYDG